MKIAFICVNYNNSKITYEYIKSILSIQGEHDVMIIVVDNASEEHDVSNLKKLDFPVFKLILSPENVGYFKGLNLGINSIDIATYDFVLIGNNDLTFDNDFLTKLEDINIDKRTMVLAPNIIRTDGIHQNPHIVKRFNKTQRIYRRLYFVNYYFALFLQNIYNRLKHKLNAEDRVGYEQQQKILMGYGACYILTRIFFEKFKTLDAPVFLMGEEGVLANQILSGGGIMMYEPSIIVHHHDHASIGKVPVRKLYEFSRQSYQHYLKNLKNIQ